MKDNNLGALRSNMGILISGLGSRTISLILWHEIMEKLVTCTDDTNVLRVTIEFLGMF